MKTKLPLRHTIGMYLLIALCSSGCERNATGQNPPRRDEATASAPKNPTLTEVQRPAPAIDVTAAGKAKDQMSDRIREMPSLRKGDRAQEGHELMKEFVAAWKPVGKRTVELEALLGRPDERRHDSLNYRFDTGWDGWKWVFTTSDDLITSVTVKGMD